VIVKGAVSLRHDSRQVRNMGVASGNKCVCVRNWVWDLGLYVADGYKVLKGYEMLLVKKASARVLVASKLISVDRRSA